jgi:hypothetical protein
MGLSQPQLTQYNILKLRVKDTEVCAVKLLYIP